MIIWCKCRQICKRNYKCQSESVSLLSSSHSTWRDHGTLFSTCISHHSNNKTNVLETFQVHNLLTGTLLLSTFIIHKKRIKKPIKHVFYYKKR